MHLPDEAWVTAACCWVPGPGRPLPSWWVCCSPVLVVSPPKQWETAPPPLGLTSLSLPVSFRFSLSHLGPVLPGRGEHLLDQCFAQGILTGYMWLLSI